MNTLQETLTPLASRLAQTLDSIKQLTEQADALKAQIRELTPGPDSYAAGNLTVVISPNRRFSPDLAAEVLNPEWLPLIQKTGIDTAKARSVLPPSEFERCMQDTGAPRVTLK